MANYTTKQWAELEGVSQRTVQRWIQEGKLEADLIKGRYYISDGSPSAQPIAYPKDTKPDEQIAGTLFISTREYAERVGVSQRTVQRWFQQNLLPGYKEKNRIFIEVAAPLPDNPYQPEIPDDEEDDSGLPITDETLFDPTDLRREFATFDDAARYAEGIPVPFEIIKNKYNLFRVVITYATVGVEVSGNEDIEEFEE